MELGTDPSALTAVPGDPTTVMSVSLDETGKHLTWVETEPMGGRVVLRSMDLPFGAPQDVELRPDDGAPVDDAVTDGAWVAIRSGTKVELHQIGGDEKQGELNVADGVTQMALRPPGGGGSNSVL
jgi:hypothetical protein